MNQPAVKQSAHRHRAGAEAAEHALDWPGGGNRQN